MKRNEKQNRRQSRRKEEEKLDDADKRARREAALGGPIVWLYTRGQRLIGKSRSPVEDRYTRTVLKTVYSGQ
jgi:hypothetical protein